jgi:hypothetical protein
MAECNVFLDYLLPFRPGDAGRRGEGHSFLPEFKTAIRKEFGNGSNPGADRRGRREEFYFKCEILHFALGIKITSLAKI